MSLEAVTEGDRSDEHMGEVDRGPTSLDGADLTGVHFQRDGFLSQQR